MNDCLIYQIMCKPLLGANAGVESPWAMYDAKDYPGPFDAKRLALEELERARKERAGHVNFCLVEIHAKVISKYATDVADELLLNGADGHPLVFYSSETSVIMADDSQRTPYRLGYMAQESSVSHFLGRKCWAVNPATMEEEPATLKAINERPREIPMMSFSMGLPEGFLVPTSFSTVVCTRKAEVMLADGTMKEVGKLILKDKLKGINGGTVSLTGINKTSVPHKAYLLSTDKPNVVLASGIVMTCNQEI